MDDARCIATREVRQHPRDLSRVLSQRLGLSRAGVAPIVRRLEAEKFIIRESAGTRPVFVAGPSRLIDERHPLPGVDESLLWERRFASLLDLPDHLANIAHYAFTEMVNNANDHADATILHVRAIQAGDVVCITVRDDGIGAFRRIAQALGLRDDRLAVLELVKGKYTSDPSRHSGEGVFFTSRAVDGFLLRANGLEYRRYEGRLEEPWRTRLSDFAGGPATGTVVVMALSLSSHRRLREVFDAYTTRGPDDLAFDRTVVPVALARVGVEHLLSRSQAKRLIARFEHFRRVDLDFSDVDEIGQGFADELFRVFPAAHPEVELGVINASPIVQRMIDRQRGNPAPAGARPS